MNWIKLRVIDVNDNEFLKLKGKTFDCLLAKSEDVIKLIRSAFVISLCHDKCISDEKLQVCEQIIYECASKIVLIPNVDVDFKTKFSLIRNKLAHGDYAYDNNKKVIVFKYLDQYVEVSLSNIIDFANGISDYYKYLNKEYDRETLYIRNGFEILIIDHCKKIRNYSYNRQFDEYLNMHCQLPFIFDNIDRVAPNGFNRKKLFIEKRFMDLECKIIGYTDEKNGMFLNPYGDKLLKNMVNLLNDDDVEFCEYKDACEMLINFYIYYIYPLDNFMKVDDQGIKSLPSEDNIDFSKFNLGNVRNEDSYEDVGKIKNYPSDFLSLYNKIFQLQSKLDSLSQWKNKDQVYNNVKLSLEKEIDDLLSLTLSGPLKRLYEYSKNRSLIEHIRCSIMHGNYDFDIGTEMFTFYDKWKGKEVYRDVVKISDFRRLFNFNNVELVVNQDVKVNRKK